MSEETTTEQLMEIEGQTEPTPATEYTPPEGWRVVRFGELLQPGDMWVNQDGTEQRSAILHWDAAAVSGGRCIRRIKPEAQPESDAELQAQVAFLKGREVTLGTRLQQEKQVTTRLREELATQAETIRRLQIELDAAQQVPADSPELRQLRADLADVTRERDQYLDSYQRIFGDLETIRETTKAETVEAIAEWLEPVQAAIAAADNVAESTRAGWLAEELIQHLPHIMRSLTGLEDEEIE